MNRYTIRGSSFTLIMWSCSCYFQAWLPVSIYKKARFNSSRARQLHVFLSALCSFSILFQLEFSSLNEKKLPCINHQFFLVYQGHNIIWWVLRHHRIHMCAPLFPMFTPVSVISLFGCDFILFTLFILYFFTLLSKWW